jgi:hypothetical protein
MPTLPYLTDTSTQLSGTYTTSAAALDNYATSNYVSNVSNLLINNINTKQAILTASTNLLGIGSSISALDYNKITLNKPTNFQADWNSTVINKPTNFQADWTSTIINKPTYFPIDPAIYYNKTDTDTLLATKQPNLTTGTTLLGTGGSITGINYNTLINKPTYTSPLSSNLATNIISINLSSYSTSGTDPAYLLKTGGTMTGALLNTSTTASEFKGIYFNHPTRITHIPYLPDNNIYFRAPLIIDHQDDYLSFGSRLGDNIIRLYGTNFGFGINGATLRYNVPVGSVHRFYHGTTNTAWIDDTGRLKATTFEGSGASLTNVPYSALTGTVPFYTKGEADTLLNAKEQILTFSSPLTRTTNTIGINLGAYSTSGADPAYVLKTGSTMTGNLTTGNLITVGIGTVATTLHLTDIANAGWKLQTGNCNLTFTNDTPTGGTFATKMTLTNAGNLTTVGTITGTTFSGSGANLNNIPYSALTGTVPFYTKGEADTLLNAKEQILTFSSPLTRTTNTIGINLSAYSTSGTDAAYVLKTGSTMTGLLTGTTINATTNLQEAGTNLISKYLTLSGGTLTGDLTGTNITGTKVNAADATGVNAACLGRLLNVVGTNAIMRIWRDNGTNSPAMEFMSGPTTSGTSYTKFWDMGIGGTTGTNFFYIRDRKPPSTSLNRLIIDDSGNIGIGTTTNASYRLNVEGSLNTTSINATGNIACGGGISLVGANAFYNPNSTITATNLTNTFLSFRGTGLGNDWAYLRNIGGDETIKLALDFHDDNDDARFCIRCVQSAGAEPDNIKEVFTVDNANTTINGNLSVATTIFANGDKLNFPNLLNQYKINLWGTNNYGFGITGGTLMYSSSQYHRFYNSGNNVNTVQFDDVGNVNMIGALSVGTTASIGGATNIGGLLRHRQSFNYGETVSYEIGYNGSPGLDGWWWTTNGFWAGYGTASYLTIAVTATSVSAVWFGRAYLAGTGGAYSVVQDYRSPDNNNTNQITVTNQWGANGANAMRIVILNPNYGGTFIIKVSG